MNCIPGNIITNDVNMCIIVNNDTSNSSTSPKDGNKVVHNDWRFRLNDKGPFKIFFIKP